MPSSLQLEHKVFLSQTTSFHTNNHLLTDIEAFDSHWCCCYHICDGLPLAPSIPILSWFRLHLLDSIHWYADIVIDVFTAASYSNFDSDGSYKILIVFHQPIAILWLLVRTRSWPSADIIKGKKIKRANNLKVIKMPNCNKNRHHSTGNNNNNFQKGVGAFIRAPINSGLLKIYLSFRPSNWRGLDVTIFSGWSVSQKKIERFCREMNREMTVPLWTERNQRTQCTSPEANRAKGYNVHAYRTPFKCKTTMCYYFKQSNQQ